MNLYLKLGLAAFLFFAGAVLGIKLQEPRVLRAQNEVSALKAQRAADEAKYKAAVTNLQSTTKALQEAALKQISDVDAKLVSAKSAWEKSLARKQGEIDNLKIIAAQRQAEVAVLRAKLELATTPEQRAELERLVLEQQALLDKAEIRVKGLECLAVPVPSEYLEKL